VAGDGTSTFSMTPPDVGPPTAPGGGGDNALIEQFIQMISGGGGMGGFGGNNPSGINPSLPMPITPDALGMGAGNPLGMGGMGMFGGGGLNPAQAAHIRMQRGRSIDALNQRMANQHRGVGRFGGTDYSRHVQNINDEMLELQEKAMQQNIENQFKASQDALNWARFNQSQDQDYRKMLLDLYGAVGTFGGAQQQRQQQGGG